jgi:hypothetical protein
MTAHPTFATVVAAWPGSEERGGTSGQGALVQLVLTWWLGQVYGTYGGPMHSSLGQ